MKFIMNIAGLCFYIIATTLSLHILGHDAFAAESSSSWRPIYDLILRWINFGIIVFVIIKYVKTPIINFLRGQKDKLAKEIQQLEDEKKNVAEKIKETIQTIDDSEIRFSELKERIVRQGEKKKEDIIKTAQTQSKMMLEDSKRRVETHFQQAKNALRAELIDRAVDMAMERLPKEITAEDDEKFTGEFLTSSLAE